MIDEFQAIFGPSGETDGGTFDAVIALPVSRDGLSAALGACLRGAARPLSTRRTGHVLVAEDNGVSRSLMRGLLERAGWRTVSFSEIDPYASAVLAERWPGVPNLGDIVRLATGSLGDGDERGVHAEPLVDEDASHFRADVRAGRELVAAGGRERAAVGGRTEPDFEAIEAELEAAGVEIDHF